MTASDVFACPSSDTPAPDHYGGGNLTAVNRCNFGAALAPQTSTPKGVMPGVACILLIYASPFPGVGPAGNSGYKLTTSTDPGFAIASDINPGTQSSVPGADNVLSVNTSSSSQQMKAGNSNNHNKDGQNVLYADGHSRSSSPMPCAA